MRRLLLAAALLLPALPTAAEPALPEAPYRERLEDILSRREFRAQPRELGLQELDLDLPEMSFPDWLGKALGRILGWLGQWLRSLFSPSGEEAADHGPPGFLLSRSAAWGMALGAALLLAFLLWRLLRRTPLTLRARTAPVSAAGEAMPDALSRPSEAWEQAAEAFAAKGQWRLALRARYLALLATLHHRRAIRYGRERTNGDYAAALAGSPAGPPFARLTLAFDEAWYGNKSFGEAGYRAALAWVRAADRETAPAEAITP